MKGLRDFDMDAAYEAMRKSATTPGANRMRPDIDPYIEKAMCRWASTPATFRATLRVALNTIADHALSLLADSLGKRRRGAVSAPARSAIELLQHRVGYVPSDYQGG